MHRVSLVAAAAVLMTSCTTTPQLFYKSPKTQGNASLCRALAESTDQQFREDVAAELISRKITTAEECQKRINVENAVIAGIAIAGAAVAVGVAANNGGLGGGGYSGGYGVAWDQFHNQYYQPIWRCRDKATGQFVDDYRCGARPMVDSTWPGW